MTRSQVGGGIVKENRVEYPEVKDIQPFSRSPLRIHFENNFPFAVFNEVVKSIYVRTLFLPRSSKSNASIRSLIGEISISSKNTSWKTKAL